MAEAKNCLNNLNYLISKYESTINSFKNNIMALPNNYPVTEELKKKNHASFSEIENSMDDN